METGFGLPINMAREPGCSLDGGLVGSVVALRAAPSSRRRAEGMRRSGTGELPLAEPMEFPPLVATGNYTGPEPTLDRG